MALAINTSDSLQRLKRQLQSALGLILRVTTFLAIAILGGLFSSWYVINRGATFNTERIGPWVKWTLAGRINSDPYSRVRYDRRAMLLFSSTFVSRYEASADDNGRRLHSSCHYAIEGPPLATEWWSLNVYDSEGRLIPNASNRYGFNRATVVSRNDGSFRIDLAREARPGNWIPTSRGGRLTVILEVQNQQGDAAVPGRAERRLPSIKRVSCE